MNFPISVFSKKIQKVIESDFQSYDAFNFLMAVASIILGKVKSGVSGHDEYPILFGALNGSASSGKSQSVNVLFSYLKGIENRLDFKGDKIIKDSESQEKLLTHFNGEPIIYDEPQKPINSVDPYCVILNHQIKVVEKIINKIQKYPAYCKFLYVFPDDIKPTINSKFIDPEKANKILKGIDTQTKNLNNQAIPFSKSAIKELKKYFRQLHKKMNDSQCVFLRAQLGSHKIYVIRLAIIFQLLSIYEQENIDWNEVKITQKSTKKAIKLLSYFEYTAFQLFIGALSNTQNGFKARMVYTSVQPVNQ